MAKEKIGTIGGDTSLITWLVAETACSTILVERFGKENLSTMSKEQDDKMSLDIKNWTEYLTEKAETIYKNSENFKRKINGKGNTGRDHLYMIMYHWMGVCDSRVYSEQLATIDHKYTEADENLKRWLTTGEIR